MGEARRKAKEGDEVIYKRGKFYWYRFKFNGKLYHQSTRILVGKGVPGEQSPKEKAKAVETGKRQQLALGEVGIKQRPPAPSFTDFCERFEKWVRVEKASKPKTVAFYVNCIRQLQKFEPFKKASLDGIDEGLIAKFIEWRTGQTRKYALRKKKRTELGDTRRLVTTASVNRDLATLRRLLHVARQWKAIEVVPVIRVLPGEKSHERVLSHVEEDRYLNAAPLLLREFASIMLDTGMRPEEICRMRWENIHLEPVNGSRFGYIHNPDGKTKWAKRNLSLTARVHGLLQLRHEAARKPKDGWVFPGGDRRGHLAYDTIDSQHDRTLTKLAPEGEPKNAVRFRLYDLRHTFLTRLGEAGADPFTIQKIAGHASILISQRYVHPTPERIENAFAKLEDYNALKVEQARKELERYQQETLIN